MAQRTSGVRHAARAQVAGWLLAAVGVIILGYLVIAAVVTAASDNAWAKAFLPAMVIVGLVVGGPPLLVGRGILRHSGVARWIGIWMGAMGIVSFGSWLGIYASAVARTPQMTHDAYVGITLLVLCLSISIVALWALATSGDFFGDRYEDLMFHPPAPRE